MYWQADAAAASGAGGAAKKVDGYGRRGQCAEPNCLSLSGIKLLMRSDGLNWAK